ncbi:MAG: hypothetical protein JSU87_14245 [Gemmatimonadota bacterium]|nr:MAG: hypothetical protein JSU87_14245 [Gemmatimonadota bacterium]
MRKRRIALPDLPLDDWEDTKLTLHLFLQIVGKIRLALMPRKNHWWNVTLYVSATGLTTGPMPYDDGQEKCEILFDFNEHRLKVFTSRGEHRTLELRERLSVAEFHTWLFDTLRELSLEPRILGKPYDLPVTKQFSEITEYAAYQPDPVERFFKLLRWVDGVFQEFSGRFYGKTCPVHLYWHHMDLAVTRFSGRRGPPLPADRGIADKDAYSHEVISFGFWVGDENVRGPAFYSYTYPSPDGLGSESIAPGAAHWIDSGGSPMALLMYEDLLQEPDPRAALMRFLEATYQAGARLAGWDIEDLTVPALSEL